MRHLRHRVTRVLVAVDREARNRSKAIIAPSYVAFRSSFSASTRVTWCLGTRQPTASPASPASPIARHALASVASRLLLCNETWRTLLGGAARPAHSPGDGLDRHPASRARPLVHLLIEILLVISLLLQDWISCRRSRWVRFAATARPGGFVSQQPPGRVGSFCRDRMPAGSAHHDLPKAPVPRRRCTALYALRSRQTRRRRVVRASREPPPCSAEGIMPPSFRLPPSAFRLTHPAAKPLRPIGPARSSHENLPVMPIAPGLRPQSRG
jgi:hypothetical protein